MTKLSYEDDLSIHHLFTQVGNNLSPIVCVEDAKRLVFADGGEQVVERAVAAIRIAYGDEAVKSRRTRTIAAMAVCKVIGSQGIQAEPRVLEGGSGKILNDY